MAKPLYRPPPRRAPSRPPELGKMAIRHLPRTLQRHKPGSTKGRAGKPSPFRKRVAGDDEMEALLRGRSYARIARSSGLAPMTIRSFFHGLSRPSMPTAVCLARGLGCSVEALWSAVSRVYAAAKSGGVKGKALRVAEAVDWGKAREKPKPQLRRRRRRVLDRDADLPVHEHVPHRPDHELLHSPFGQKVQPRTAAVASSTTTRQLQNLSVPRFDIHPTPPPRSISSRFALAPTPSPASEEPLTRIGWGPSEAEDWD